jgi:hypothetical protein
MIFQATADDHVNDVDDEDKSSDEEAPQQGAATEQIDQQDSRRDTWDFDDLDTTKLVVAAEETVHKSFGQNCLFVAFGICFCLSCIGIGILVVVLVRLGREHAAGHKQPVLAIFDHGSGDGDASPTNAALAWLVAALLQGTPFKSGNADAAWLTIGPAPFIPDDEVVQSWQPQQSVLEPTAVVHGEVAMAMQAKYEFGPDRLQYMTAEVTHESVDHASETDALLELRHLYLDVHSVSDNPDTSTDARAELGGTPSELILVSHPQHLPNHAVVAKATGLVFRTLHPSFFASVPWADFGCGDQGYPSTVSASDAIEREAQRLDVFVGELDQDQMKSVEEVLKAARATLKFYRCVAIAGKAEACLPKH